MVGYEMVKTVGGAAATYKFTPKFVLKAGQKVTVRTDLEAQEFKMTNRFGKTHARALICARLLFNYFQNKFLSV